jgi:hypothetical protein
MDDTANLWYDESRKFLLAYHPWDFAEAYHTCSRSGTPDNDNYDDMYRLPNDFLELISIEGSGQQSFTYSSEYGKVDWTREGNNILLNNGGGTSVDIVYTKNFNTPSQFSSLFTKALVYELAANMALDLTKDAKLEDLIRKRADKVLNEATSIDGQGKRVRRVEYSRAISARTGQIKRVTDPYRIQ